MTKDLMPRSYWPMHEPLRNLERMMDDMIREFRLPEFFSTAPRYGIEEIKETKESYVMKIPMPGVTQDNLKVTLEDNVLTIDAQMKDKQDDKKKDDGVLYLTRKLSEFSYHRQWELPAGVKDVSPVYENGLLEITIKKPEGMKTEAKTIEVQYKK